ncbi:AMP-binding protein [Streptomyces sp. SID13031]|uniref:AMP-binding protein n=1 Tax=Streptomyces sp. SID13031 TaxID=2706046 RepID=UPI0013CBA90D|nr:AMP-binding protein [Streptomyces sp. SID13031]NEA30520.1 AMP-binding protein [Streptomyces sp. SID13031]
MPIAARVAELVLDHAPVGTATPAGPARLVEDLGFDSLHLMELLVSLQVEFGLEPFDDAELIGLSSVADLTTFVTSRIRPETGPETGIELSDSGALLGWLGSPRTDAGISWLDDNGEWISSSYAELAAAALGTAAWLRDQGVEPGDVVSLTLARVDDFVAAFFGVLAAGGVPSPLAPPLALGSLDNYVDHAAHLLALADPRLVIADAGIAEHLTAAVAKAALTCQVSQPLLKVDPASDATDGAITNPDPAAVALLQFTSGSSGRPRGIRLTVANLGANIGMIRRWLALGRDELTVTWLPLHHDMGLIGCLLTPIVNQSPLRTMRPDQFIRDPLRWLRCLGADGASVAVSPTFGFAYSLSRIKPEALAGLDFSNWRVAIVGAERVDPFVLQRFATLLEPHGFQPGTFRPAYGLAEATLAVTGTHGETPLAVRPDWSTMVPGQPVSVLDQGPLGAVPAGPGWVTCCGQPHPALLLEVLDDEGQPLPPGHFGEVAVSGPSVSTMAHLGGSTSATRLTGTQLRTGDAGFLYAGQLVVVGRTGDSLKVRGRHLFAEELEARLATETGLPAGRIAIALGIAAGRETAVLVCEQTLTDGQRAAAEAVLTRETGGADVRIETGPRGLVLRTSSGKTRRRELWQRYSG